LWYPKDFLSSSRVMLMSMAERGAYITLLSCQWLNGVLPDDEGKLARLCGVGAEEFSQIWQGVSECFEPNSSGSGLVNPRLEEERGKQAQNREKKAAAGRAGMVSRWAGHNKAITEPITEVKQADNTAITPEITEGVTDGITKDNLAVAVPVPSPTEDLPTEESSTEECRRGSAEGGLQGLGHNKAITEPITEASPKASAKSFDPRSVPVPEALDTPAFRDVWERRIRERAEPGRTGAKPSQSQIEAQLSKLEKLAAAKGLDFAIECVERAIESRHQGTVFPEDFQEKPTPRSGDRSPPAWSPGSSRESLESYNGSLFPKSST
jgi:uncharacterized protein YdaU (DUF1376 family)